MKKTILVFGFISAFFGACILIRGTQLFIGGNSLINVLHMFFLSFSLVLFLPVTMKRKNEAQLFFIFSISLYAISCILQGIVHYINGDNKFFLLSIILSGICALSTLIFVKDIIKYSKVIGRIIIASGMIRIISAILSYHSYLGAFGQNEYLYVDNTILWMILSAIMIVIITVAPVLYFSNNEDVK